MIATNTFAVEVDLSLYGLNDSKIPSSYISLGGNPFWDLNVKTISAVYENKEHAGFGIDFPVLTYKGVALNLDAGYLGHEYYTAYSVSYSDLSILVLNDNVFFNYKWEL
jgi:hypothetical protein